MEDIQKFEDYLERQQKLELQQFLSSLNPDKFTDREKNNILSILNTECSDFIREIKSTNTDFLFRGVFGNWIQVSNGIYLKKTREDRIPRDTSNEFSKIFDTLFYQEFRAKIRSGGITVTKNPLVANYYSPGNIFLFFPRGDYRYFWNSGVKDLWKYVREEDWYWDDYDKPSYENEITKIVKGYREDGIENVKDQEINFLCKDYYLVDVNLLSFLKSNL